MTGADAAPGPAGSTPDRDHADVLAVCRWLPQEAPWGAFSGRHDYVHVGDRQGRVNLWWSDFCVHRGDYVGPPRGGLVPDHYADYDVAMPSGGYLHIRSGVLADWTDATGAVMVLRADGEEFTPQRYGPSHPYWLADYRQMTAEDQRNALAGVRHRRDATRSDENVAGEELLDAIARRVASARMPSTCACTGGTALDASRGLGIPASVLTHAGAVAALTGTADAATSADVVWRLTAALADPDRAGLVRAAEAAARRSADSVAGWPDGPLTEEAVAVVAAQVLRWHGRDVVAELPFWVLGWIFIAEPVFESLLPPTSSRERERLTRELLQQADRVRVDRVAQTLAAAHRAEQLLRSVTELADSADPMTVIDLREEQPPPPRPVIPEPREAPPAYQRSIGAVVSDLA